HTNTPLGDAVANQRLPKSISNLFGDLYDDEAGRFRTQETAILDFKETVPPDYTGSYGASIIRLGIAFHNTFGGAIVFGVVDRLLKPVGVDTPFNIEFFNRALSDFTGVQVECVCQEYSLVVEGKSVSLSIVL